jgi:hypothetical protein
MRGTDLEGIGNFQRYVNLVSYGDDNALNIHETVIDRFNQQTITTSMTKFGMTYTDENKSTDVLISRNITQISFLKRHFAMFENRCYAPLALETLLEAPLWCKPRNPLEVNPQTVETCEMMLQEWAHYDIRTYTIAASKLASSLRECCPGVIFKVPSHREQRAALLGLKVSEEVFGQSF